MYKSGMYLAVLGALYLIVYMLMYTSYCTLDLTENTCVHTFFKIGACLVLLIKAQNLHYTLEVCNI